MFCIKCGSPIAKGNSFCTKCGTKVENLEMPEAPEALNATQSLNNGTQAAPESLSQNNTAQMPTAFQAAYEQQGGQAAQERTAEPLQQKPQNKSKKPLIIVLVVLLIAALIAGGVFVYFNFLTPDNTVSATSEEAADTSTVVNYNGAETISAQRNTRFVPYGKDGNPLSSYSVILISKTNNDAHTAYTYSIEGINGFRLSDFPEVPEDTYDTYIADGEGYLHEVGTITYDPTSEDNTSDESGDNEEVITLTYSEGDEPQTVDEAIPSEYYGVETITEDMAIPSNAENTSTTSYTWSYVQLTCLLPSTTIDSINSAVKAAFEEAQANAITMLDEDIVGAVVRHYDIACTYLSDDYVSFRIRSVDSLFGSREGYDTNSLTFNLHTGEQIDATELWGYSSNNQLESDTTTATKSARADWSEEAYADSIEYAASENMHPCYFITDEGLTFETSADMYYDGNSTYFATVVIAPLDEMTSETEASAH